MVQWDSRFFGDADVRTEHFEELTGTWRPWGPFDLSLDYFGDGSFWVIQAPGHMAGNLAACARLESGDHVVLASDCCHSRYVISSLVGWEGMNLFIFRRLYAMRETTALCGGRPNLFKREYEVEGPNQPANST